MLLMNALADRYGRGRIQFTRQNRPVLEVLCQASGAKSVEELFDLLKELDNCGFVDRDPLFQVAFSGVIPEYSWTDVLGRPLPQMEVES